MAICILGRRRRGDWDLQVGLCANGRSSLQESTVKTKNCEESLLVDLFNKPDRAVALFLPNSHVTNGNRHAKPDFSVETIK